MGIGARHRILFITHRPPFTHHFKQIDFDILATRYDVSWFDARYNPLAVAQLQRRLRASDLAFCWYANTWAACAARLGRRMGVKTVIVTGGMDVANVPAIGYGMQQQPLVKHIVRYALNHADCVLPVSRANQAETLSCARPRRLRMIYNAVRCGPVGALPHKRRQVVTVGQINRVSSLRKGHFIFLEIARRLPDVPCILYGRPQDRTFDRLRRLAPPNVEFRHQGGRAEVERLLAESRVYVQMSYHEAFSVSTVEAMWYGCTPVVSDRAALPEVVGAAGIVLPLEDPGASAKAILGVLDQDSAPDRAAMARAGEFTLERRTRELLEEVERVLET